MAKTSIPKVYISGYVPVALGIAFKEKSARQGIKISQALTASLTLWVGDNLSGEEDNAALRQYGKIARVRNELARLGVSQTSIETSVERFGNEPDEFWDKYLGAYREMYKKREPVA